MKHALPLLLALALAGPAAAQTTAQHEDAAHVSGQYGEMCLAVRQDAAAALAAAGDYIPLIVDASGRLWTNAVQSGAWTVTANAGSGTFQVGDGSGPLTVDGTLTCNAGTGTFTVGDGSGALTVDGTVTVTDGAGALNVIVDSGTITANQGGAPWSVAGPAADGAAVSGNPVRIAGKDGSGNTQDIITDSAGELQVDVLTLPANASVNLAQVAGATTATGNGTAAGSIRVSVASDSTGQVTLASGTTTAVTQATASSLNAEVQGDAASDTAVSGNPVLTGGRASAAAPTDVGADGRAVSAWYLRNGAQASVVTAAGALIGGDAANGLDVDVTRVSGTVNVGDGSGPLTVDGTVTTTPPSNASTNVAQFGGTNVVTGTGTSGSGIPRVTVSTDSAITQGTAAATTAGWPIVMGNTARTSAAWTSATSIDTTLSISTLTTPMVGITMRSTSTITAGALIFEASDDNTNWFAVSVSRINAGTAELTYTIPASTSQGWQVSVTGYSNFRVRLNPAITGTGTVNVAITSSASGEQAQVVASQSDLTKLNGTVNVSQVGGSAVSTAAAGVQKVGTVGNAGAAFDAANNSAAPANVVAEGWQLQTGAQATAGTAGQIGSPVAGLDHVPYARLGGPVQWSCSLDNIGATLTQCKAATGAGIRAYITDIVITSTTATAGQFLVRTGTGSNCGTGTASLFPSSATVVRFPYPANTSTIGSTTIHLLTPLQPPAASAICILCVATNTCTVQFQGYEAP